MRPLPSPLSLCGLGAGLVITGLLGGCAGRLPQLNKPAAEPTRISDAAPITPVQPGSNVIVEAVEKVGPAVVRIDTVKRTVDPMGGLFGRD